ncbi:MAG: SH3 domain-containing protein [Flavobacteriaceae bacterium]|nr:SH3 domain-containing protein [Flavobacteriaceae bacterium]
MKNLFLFVLLMSLTQPLTAQSLKYVSAENGLFTRLAPDRGSRAIAKLHYGTKVEVMELTGLQMDLMDRGEKITGQWVKVKARLPQEEVTGYVYDAYLTNEELDPRSVIPFDNMNVIIHGMELYESEGQDYETKREMITFYADLGVTPEAKFIKIQPKKNYKRISVYQSYETSLTVMNEGPHCDLINWKHYNSLWLPLNEGPENTYQTLKYSTTDGSVFVNVDIAELKEAVLEHCGESYAELIQNKTQLESPAAVSISIIYLKIVMIDSENQSSERTIAFEIPMGC